MRSSVASCTALAAMFLLACIPSHALASTNTCPGTDSLKQLTDCDVVDGDLIVDRADDDQLARLTDVRRVTGSLKIRQSPELTDLEALSRLRRVDGDLQLITTPALAGLDGLKRLNRVGGELHFVDPGVDTCQIEQFIADLNGISDDDVTVVNAEEPTDDQCADNGEAPASSATDLPINELPDLDDMQGGELLEGVHPELVDRIRLMYAILKKEDIELVFVSGYRPHKHFYDRENRYASWHNLGMAVDLHMANRSDLHDARANYDEDEETWQRVGDVANGLGIIWGEWFGDPFHFEWHPDYRARIRSHEFEQFQQLAGDDLEDYQKVWQLFEDGSAEDDADDCSGGCHIIPDDGLRKLLEKLR